jgi:hypothetical protein
MDLNMKHDLRTPIVPHALAVGESQPPNNEHVGPSKGLLDGLRWKIALLPSEDI